MKLIAAGRASEVFDLGDGCVLRRFRADGDSEREALVMRHARRKGYPVPRVVEVMPDGIVMERIDGNTMLGELQRRPWTVPRHAGLLARLHVRLHEVAAPPDLPAAGAGDHLLHLDLHPENVIMSPKGPFVIDWTNARRGDPALDVALTWVIVATRGGLLARAFLHSFLRHFERADLVAALPAAAARRVADPNLTDPERRAVRGFVERAY